MFGWEILSRTWSPLLEYVILCKGNNYLIYSEHFYCKGVLELYNAWKSYPNILPTCVQFDVFSENLLMVSQLLDVGAELLVGSAIGRAGKAAL